MMSRGLPDAFGVGTQTILCTCINSVSCCSGAYAAATQFRSPIRAASAPSSCGRCGDSVFVQPVNASGTIAASIQEHRTRGFIRRFGDKGWERSSDREMRTEVPDLEADAAPVPPPVKLAASGIMRRARGGLAARLRKALEE